jgi:uncharacterized protein (TIRG00374 family)
VSVRPGADLSRPLRTTLRVAAGMTVSGACLYFAMRGTEWARVREVLARAHPVWVLAGGLAVGASIVIRARRWVELLRPVADVGMAAALSSTAIGVAATAVLPLRLGELVRPALLARRTGIGLTPALSSVVLERLFDLGFVVLCFLLLSAVYPLPAALRAGARGLAIAAAGGFVVLIVAQRRRETSERWLHAILGRLPARLAGRLQSAVSGLLDGLKGLADPRTVLVVCALSACLWGVVAAAFLCSILALDIAVPLVPAALASVVVVAAFVFLPQAPGFVGTWQAGCVVALGLFGVPSDMAVGYSLLTWVLSMTVNIGAGGLFLAREDLSLRDLV